MMRHHDAPRGEDKQSLRAALRGPLDVLRQNDQGEEGEPHEDGAVLLLDRGVEQDRRRPHVKRRPRTAVRVTNKRRPIAYTIAGTARVRMMGWIQLYAYMGSTPAAAITYPSKTFPSG